MAGTPEGHIESIHEEEEATPMNDLDDGVKGETGASPNLWVEQLKAQHLELEEARLQHEQERAELDWEIKRHGDGGRACAMACDVNQRIVADDEALPHFTRVIQNIAATAALLCGLLGPMMPEDRQAHHEIRLLLERTVAQQAESSLSQ